jgi:putative transposase
MHLTLKKESTKRAGRNFLQQQARFDDFIEIFNQERPHEALDMKCPTEVYRPATRLDQGLPDIDYPFHDKTVVVTHCGRICPRSKKINLSTVFAGQAVGIKEVNDDLGYFDLETRMLEPRQPVRPEVVTYVAGTFCYPCPRAGP